MAISFVAAGTFASGTTTAAPGLPAGVAAGDLLILAVETANVAVATPAGWNVATSSPVSTGPANTAGGIRLSVFWRFFQTGDTAPSVSATGADHTTARIHAFRGVDSATPFDGVTPTTSTAAASTTLTMPGLTTVTANAWVVHLVGRDEDNGSTNGVTGAPTNAGLTGLAERTDQVVNAGSGGGLFVATGLRATPGATGNTTATQVSSAFVALTLALRPAILGSVSSTLSGATVTSTATVSGVGAISGSVNATLQPATGDETAAVRVAGQVSATLANATAASTATVANAAPISFVGKGSFASGTTSLTPGLPAGLQAGDLMVLALESESDLISVPGGWSQVAGSPFAIGTPNNPGSVWTRVYTRVFQAGDTAPTITSTNALHAVAIVLGFRGVDQTTPLDATPVFSQGSGTTISLTGITTATADAVVLAIAGLDVDVDTTDQVTGAPTNGTLAFAGFGSGGELHDEAVALGNGGGLWIAAGRKATAGATGSISATMATGSAFAAATLALRPAPAGGGVAGQVAATLSPATGLASAAVAVAGQVNATLAPATADETAAVRVAGSTAATLAPASGAASGAIRVAGQVDQALAPATVSATASSAAITLASTNATLAPATGQASASIRVAGQVFATLAPATADEAASVRVAGQVNAALAPASLAAVAGARVAGQVVADLQPATGQAAGAVSSPALSATVSATLSPAIAAASGAVRVVGQVSASLDGATLSATATLAAVRLASTNATLAPATGQATAGVRVAGQAVATLQPATADEVAAVRVAGQVGATLGPATGSGSASVRIAGQVVANLAPATADEVATVLVAGQVSTALAPATGQATAGVRVSGSASLTLAPATLVGQALAPNGRVGQVAATLQPATVAGLAVVVSTRDPAAIVSGLDGSIVSIADGSRLVRFGGASIVSVDEGSIFSRASPANVSIAQGEGMTTQARLRARTNADLSEIVERRTAADQAVNVTGYTFRFQVKATPFDASPVISATLGSGVTIVDAAAGKVRVFVDKAALAAIMPAGALSWLGVYDLQATAPDGTDEVWIAGDFTLTRGIAA